jgi:hypothetical protein
MMMHFQTILAERTQIMFTANFMEREITHSNFLKYQASRFLNKTLI